MESLVVVAGLATDESTRRVEQWRGRATRYDTYAVTYLGGFLLGMVILTHRADV